MLVLKNHFNGNDTLVHKGYVMNGCQFFSIENSKEVLIKHNVPEKVWDQVLNAIKDSSVNLETSIDPDASIDIVEFAYCYCLDISNDLDMKQIVIDAKDPRYAYRYCRYIANDLNMRQVIIDAKDTRYAYLYCRDVSNDPDMKQVIIDAKDAYHAYRYCKNVDNDPNMKQIVNDDESAVNL